MKKLYKLISILCILVIMASSTLLPVSAAQTSSNTFVMSCGTPTVSGYTGYVEFLLYDEANNKYFVRTFMWSFYDKGLFEDEYNDNFDLSNIPVYVHQTYHDNGSSTKLSFNFGPLFDGINSRVDGIVYSQVSGSSSGQSVIVGTMSYDKGTTENYVYVTRHKVISYHCYGYVQIYNYTYDYNDKEFYVLYAENGAVYNAIVDGNRNQNDKLNQIIIGQQQQTADIIAGQQQNTDEIINAGSDVDQPDFDSANGQLNDTTTQMNDIEGQYKIDQTGTQTALSGGTNFIGGSGMQVASVQVKNWIERFTSENKVMLGFFISIMCLGLCFWVIGRKAAGF